MRKKTPRLLILLLALLAVPACSGGGADEAGEAATGEAATGEAATGEAATGEAATGEAATGEAATGEAATGDAATGEAVQPRAQAGSQRAALPGLFAIMLELQGDMERVSRGIWTGSFDTISAGARAIAEHPKIPPEELSAVAEALGPDLPRFKEVDTRVHDLSVELAEAARAGDMARVLERDAAIREGCVECHTTFRERLRSEID